MPLSQTNASGDRFFLELDQICAKIESLPEDRRPHFRALADEAARRHRQLQEDCASARSLLGDMNLAVTNATFNAWAAWSELR